jgi:alpha-tubulin suppressor-like RCC1 family protein
MCLSLLLPNPTTQGQTTVTRISAGSSYSSFLRSDKSFWAMGYNFFGSFDAGAIFVDTNQPLQIASGSVIAIAAGGGHTLFTERHITALHSTTELWGVGNNHYGQLGVTNTFNTSQPEMILSYSTPNIGSPVTTVAAGAVHSVFIKSDGSLWTMGYNGNGQLGDGTINDSHVPLEIMSSNVTAIAAGSGHTLFLKSDGSLWGMGYNASGELGDGTTTDRHLPVQIVSNNVTSVAAGAAHSLFLKTDGSLWGMGDNGSGQLGDGTTTNRLLPVQIVSSNVTAVAGGGGHSLFIKSDGSLWGMGFNGQSQLGDGTATDRHLPVQIVSSNVTAVAGGDLHSLFLKSDGSLWGMGANGSGQLGLNLAPYIPINLPSRILPLTIPVAIYEYEDVANGGFERGDFSIWVTNGNFSSTDNLVTTKSGYVHSGSNGAELGPVGPLGYLSQTLITTPGATYLLSFWLQSPDGETPNEFLVSWNGTRLMDKTNLTATGWTHFQFPVTAAGNTAVLQFGFRNDPSHFGLDDISVVRTVHPAITGISLAGTTLTLNGNNGFFGVAYQTLTSTNVSLPLNQWTPIATNVLGAGGNFTITATNALALSAPLQFYILQVP